MDKYIKVDDLINSTAKECSKHTLCKGCPLSVYFTTFSEGFNVCYAEELRDWLKGVV